MDPSHRSELKEGYKNRRPQMGVLALRCKATGESFLEASKDIQASTNGITFKLDSGYHPNRRLLQLWQEHGRDGFEISTLQTLEYKDEVDDYTDDLEALRDLCLESDPLAKKVWR